MFERITEETFEDIFPLLEEAFPETELRTKADQKALLQEPCYRLYGVKGAMESYLAVFAIWEIETFLYIEHFAVKKEYHNRGYGGALLDNLLEEKGKPVVLEVEPPKDALTRRRVGFYQRHGFAFNGYPYLQPPMRKGHGMLPLRLMTWPGGIDEETYERYKDRLYRIVYKYKGECV